MDSITLIANSGIHLFTFPISIDFKEKFKMWYHEWYDTKEGRWLLDPVQEICAEDIEYYYNKKLLYESGYLNDPSLELLPDELKDDGIIPLRINEENYNGVQGDIFSMTFSDRDNTLPSFENVWLPIPYFFKKTLKKFKFGPLNWSRFKMIPKGNDKGIKYYDIVLAFDTRAQLKGDEYDEYPIFPDAFKTDMDFELCSDEFKLMDYCSASDRSSYINEYIFHLVHPDIRDVSSLKGSNIRRMSYIASYTFLISYLTKRNIFPKVKLYKNTDVEVKDVDMVVDIGNSKTTALLIEDNSNFNQVRKLELVDYTNLIKDNGDLTSINKYDEPFDMRLAFRKVNFGNFGLKDSKQFIYPSLVRLGQEANFLIHKATSSSEDAESLTTYSSPKRYLWDWRPNEEEWKFLVLEGEKDEHVLNLPGLTNQLKSDGTIDHNGTSGSSYHYSRRSLMTLCFLEMLVQARTQINSEKYRSIKTGFGKPSMPRRIRRIIVTCPTAMSKVEREALVLSARDAVVLLENFEYENPSENPKPGKSIEVIPSPKLKDYGGSWYYDEATCSQLVYMYGEVGHKYKGCCKEFFALYGKEDIGATQPSITIGSIDIGAGTSDLMVCKYSYIKNDVATITPNPLFYDSYYQAGDDMLHALIKNIMLLDENSAFREELKDLSSMEYRQKIKNFFGTDYNGQTMSDRVLRKDFNIQYSVPLMCYFLELLKNGSNDCVVSYADVFTDVPPNDNVIEGFREKLGIDIRNLRWKFDRVRVADVARKEFEPLLKKVATIMYSYACDIILLSGRPASLPIIRDILLTNYPISPNRLILLNNYYVGDWYPFSNNTGYIKNAKTIVAMGGVIGYYASEFSNLNKFIINLEALNQNLKSTVNYIEASRKGQPIEYLISPEKNIGNLTISKVPTILNVRQVGRDTYPSRALYSLDFNRYKIAEQIKKKAALDNDYLTDASVSLMVNETIDSLRKRMPFNVTIERDEDDKELLKISSIIDKEGNEIKDGSLEIHIQSLGADERYWLDSGEFDF